MKSESFSRVGLCSDCRFAGVQRSERGSEFWRCRLSDTDERFVRYPPLPVAECGGYERREADPTAGQ